MPPTFNRVLMIKSIALIFTPDKLTVKFI